MNVTIYYTKTYNNVTAFRRGKNKPNSNPIKPNFRKAQMNVNSLTTKDYRKNDDFTVRINKPNSNPISSKPKMSASLYLIEDYENETAFRPKKTNPIQTQCRNSSRAPSCPGCLFINRTKRKQSQKDFPDFLEKMPFMVLTNGYK